jgi:hypothetical protein
MITSSYALDFQTGVLPAAVTLTRALNTATRVNSSGLIELVNADLPRFDYNPATLAAKGLLIEETRANLIKYSAAFDDAVWVTGVSGTGVLPVVTADYGTSPDGTNNADRLQLNSGAAGLSQIQQSPGGTTTAVHTFSVYMRSLTSNVTVTLFLLDAIQNVTVTTSWQRFIFTRTPAALSTVGARIAKRDVWGSTGVADLLVYGAQLEAGAFSTSYIPTTLAAVTRNADVATITGTDFSDFWQAGKGGAQVQVTPSTVSGIRPLVQFDDNTADNIIALRGNTTNPELQIVDGGTPQATIDAGTIAANTPYSLTGWWDTNDCKVRKDSGAVVADTTATIPTVTQMRIGSDGTNYLNGTIATINYYNTFFGQLIYTRRKNKVFSSLL